MIEFTGVTKKLDGFTLKDISLKLPKGYIMGLVGPNGAGKTTLLHLLLGLYRPNEGEITVFGKSYDGGEREIKNDIGYVLAEELFCGEMTLLENAAMYGKYYENYEESLFTSYCERFQLDTGKKLKKQSKGQQLKFQFAFALAHQPKLLVLDEPTANFDPKFREEFRHILTDFVKDGEKSVLLATHLTKDLDRMADYIAFLHKGQLIFSMDREMLCEKYRLVGGEDYKIRLLHKEKVIFAEKGEFGTKALVKHSKWNEYDRQLTVTIPTIEELMYYIIKGGGHA